MYSNCNIKGSVLDKDFEVYDVISRIILTDWLVVSTQNVTIVYAYLKLIFMQETM